MNELSVQYANGTTSETDKESIASEATQLKEEITRVGETTKFNGVALLSEEATISFQVGANDEEVIAVKTLNLEKATEGAELKADVFAQGEKVDVILDGGAAPS